MALLKFKKGLYSQLPTTHSEGTVYITTDEKAMYVDISDSDRIRIGQIITLTKSDWQALPRPFSEDVFYYITDINALIRWNGTSWIQINSTDALKSRIESLESRATAVEGKASANETAINALKTTVQGEDGNGGLKGDLATLEGKIEALEVTGGQANVIEKITVNGTEVAPTNKTVALGKLASVGAKVAETDLHGDLSTKINSIQTTANGAVQQTVYNEKVAALQKEIDDAEAAIATVNTTLGNKFNTTDKTVTNVVNGIENTIGGHTTTLTQHGESITSLNTSVNTNTADIIQLKKDVIANAAAAKTADDKAVAADGKAVVADGKAVAAQNAADAAQGTANEAKTKAENNATAISGIHTTIETLATKTALAEQKTALEGKIQEAKNDAKAADDKAVAAQGKADANALLIAQNAADISTHTTAIEANATEIAKKVNNTDYEARVGENGTLTKAVSDNTKAISDNATAIGENATAIAANAKSIAANATAISGLEGRIGDLTNVMNFRGAVIDTDSVVDPQPGDVVVIISTGAEYVYDETNGWLEFGNSTATSSAIANLGSGLQSAEGRITDLESVVGDETKGLVKTVAAHGTALNTHATDIATLMATMTWGTFND